MSKLGYQRRDGDGGGVDVHRRELHVDDVRHDGVEGVASSVKHVFALSEGIIAPFVGFVYAVHLSIVAFALHALDSVGGTLGVGVCAFVSNAGVRILHIGTHICTAEALATYHQSFWTQMDAVNGIAWVASGRRALDRTRVARTRRFNAGAPGGRGRRVVGGETEEEK